MACFQNHSFLNQSLLQKGLVRLKQPPLPLPPSLQHKVPPQHSLHYDQAIRLLVEFRNSWHAEDHTKHPFFVWITNPLSATKLNMTHFFSHGFCPDHCLFLESKNIQRTVSILTNKQKHIAALVLDGYPSDRVVLQMARRWLKQQGSTLLKADELEELRSPAPSLSAPEVSQQRLFIMGK